VQLPAPNTAISRSSRLAPALAIVALGLAAALAAATRIELAGHWQGLFLLAGKGARPLELKDDLFLGDGSRLLAGVSFSRVRTALGRSGARMRSGQPRLELDWDEASGSGVVRNHLAGGGELLTSFARYEDDQGKRPRGLFVGGALPDAAADVDAMDESGMSYRSASGWQHVWCNVNEGLGYVGGVSFPGGWRFLGSRVLIEDPQRVVLESSHDIDVGRGDTLRMDRFAYFRAGKPWFKLGIRIANAGERPVVFTYVYGDEPWVGEFGSAQGNVGWVNGQVVRTEAIVDPREHRWAGIIDEKSRTANFISWMGDGLPDRVFFGNGAGSIDLRPGQPLSSNEVFIGLEWEERTLQPGDHLSILLTIGRAEYPAEADVPLLPEGAGPPP
jgi:hypothetical protein